MRSKKIPHHIGEGFFINAFIVTYLNSPAIPKTFADAVCPSE